MLIYSVNPDEATERALDRHSRIAVDKALHLLGDSAGSVACFVHFGKVYTYFTCLHSLLLSSFRINLIAPYPCLVSLLCGEPREAHRFGCRI